MPFPGAVLQGAPKAGAQPAFQRLAPSFIAHRIGIGRHDMRNAGQTSVSRRQGACSAMHLPYAPIPCTLHNFHMPSCITILRASHPSHLTQGICCIHPAARVLLFALLRVAKWHRGTGSSTMQEACSPARCGLELELDICGKLGVAAAAADARQDGRLQRCSCRGATVQLTFPRQQRTILLPCTGAWSRMGSRPSAPAPWTRPSQTRWTCWAAATVSPITYSTASSQICMVSPCRYAGPQRRCMLPQQGIMLLPVSVLHVAPSCSDVLLFPRSTHGCCLHSHSLRLLSRHADGHGVGSGRSVVHRQRAGMWRP